MEINTRFIKGYFKFEIPNSLEIDSDVSLVLEGSIVKCEIKSLQNGECDEIAVFKAVDGTITN